MKKFLMIAAVAASFGGFAASATQASAAVSPLNPIAIEKTETAGTTAAKGDYVQVAGGFRGRGYRGHRFHRGYRGHGFHYGHGRRWHHWGHYRPAYYGGCFVRKIWTDYGPVYRRICRY